MLRRKSLATVRQQEASHAAAPRAYGLYSLLAVGVGGTVGSGIFVLSGAIARQHAGPATCLSWLLGGLVCMPTALVYAELICRVPSAGSAYSFAFHGLGEVFAAVGALLLTLEYGLSGAAVARSWGDKLAFYLGELGVAGCAGGACWINALGGTHVNLAAGVMCALATALLGAGVEVGRRALNVLVVLKVALVLFVIAVGLTHFEADNLRPFVPPPAPPGDDAFTGGWHGVFLGTTVAFFGYIGFDEVICLSTEAINPRRDVPLAVLATIAIITVLYALASLALAGMAPFAMIDPQEGFGSAFRSLGLHWAVHVVMAGQILFVLPAVVLVSFLPQGRLLAVMAHDGLLPARFTERDKSGNLTFAVVSSGGCMSVVAMLVPFRRLGDLISAGILTAFTLSSASLLVIRARHTPRGARLTGVFVLSSALAAFALAKNAGWALALLPTAVALVALVLLRPLVRSRGDHDSEGFAVPGVPFVPGASIYLNWWLTAQLELEGLEQIVLLVAAGLVAYAVFFACRRHRGTHARLALDEDGLPMPPGALRSLSFTSDASEDASGIELARDRRTEEGYKSGIGGDMVAI